MLTDIASTIITGALSGGATGLLGVGLKIWDERNKRAHDLQVMQLEHQATKELRESEQRSQERLATLGAQSAETLATINAEARAIEQQSEDLRASYGHDKAAYLTPESQQAPGWGGAITRGLMAVVDFLRGIIRPVATIYGFVLLTLLLLWVRDMWGRAGGPITPEVTNKIALDVVGTATYLVVTTTVWWFGVRPQGRR